MSRIKQVKQFHMEVPELSKRHDHNKGDKQIHKIITNGSVASFAVVFRCETAKEDASHVKLLWWVLWSLMTQRCHCSYSRGALALQHQELEPQNAASCKSTSTTWCSTYLLYKLCLLLHRHPTACSRIRLLLHTFLQNPSLTAQG